MSRIAAVAGLALRDLWISYRLLTAVAVFGLGGAAIVMSPAAPGRSLALGLAVAIAIAAGLVASAIADARAAGFLGWLSARAVPRPLIGAAWLAAAWFLGLGGLAVAAVTALAIAANGNAPPSLPAAIGTLGATLPAIVALALVAALVGGRVLGPLVAAALTAAWLVPVALVVPASLPVPGAGLAMLAAAGAGDELGLALRSAGASLVAGALLWAVALAALGRADL